jgi:hypothetical protein
MQYQAVVLLVAAGATTMPSGPRHGRWPRVQPMQASVTFANLARDTVDTPYFTVIRDVAGHVAYTVECHNGHDNEERKIDYSGDFQCGVFAAAGDGTVANLLASATKDEESTDWFNRGRMLSTQLVGRCADYPEYGAIRHFRFRGLRVTFAFSDLQWGAMIRGSPALNAFMFTLSAVPDPTAHTTEAAIVHVVKPPASCDRISSWAWVSGTWSGVVVAA